MTAIFLAIIGRDEDQSTIPARSIWNTSFISNSLLRGGWRISLRIRALGAAIVAEEIRCATDDDGEKRQASGE
jgi:hypothetical protein